MTGLSDPMAGSGSRRWGRLLLIASLSLNLLLAGVLGAWAVRPLFHGPSPSFEFGRMIERMSHRLSSADAAALRHAYDAHRQEMGKLRDSVRDARRKVRRALRADPFDPSALKSAMDEVRTTRSAMEESMQNVISDGAASMSEEGRRRLAQGPHRRP